MGISIPVFYLLGQLLAAFFPSQVGVLTSALLIAAFAIFFTSSFLKVDDEVRIQGLLLPIAILIGAQSVAMLTRTPSLAEIGLEQQEEKPRRRQTLLIEGLIRPGITRPRRGELRVVFLPEHCHVRNCQLLLSTPDLPWTEARNLAPGTTVRVEVSLRRRDFTSRYSEPFSYLSYLHRRGIAGTGRLLNLEIIQAPSQSPDWWAELIDIFGSSDSLALLIAAVLGKSDLLGEHVESVFQRTGTTHLLVVSGFHLAIVFSLVQSLAKWFFCFFRILILGNRVNSLAMGLGLLVAATYGFLTGVCPPVLRAILALTLTIIVTSFQRRIRSQVMLIYSLAAVSTFWPASFLEAGVQFTFASIVGLIVGHCLWQRFRKIIVGRDCRGEDSSANVVSINQRGISSFSLKVVDRCGQHLFLALGAWVFTAPLVYLWFGQFNAWSPLINALIAVPFTFCTVVLGGIALGMWYLALPGRELLMRVVLWTIRCLYSLLESFA